MINELNKTLNEFSLNSFISLIVFALKLDKYLYSLQNLINFILIFNLI